MINEKTETSPQGVQKRPGVRLTKADDVRRLLSRLINETMQDQMETDKLRAISYACQTLLKVFELKIVEQRLEEIERRVDEIRTSAKTA